MGNNRLIKKILWLTKSACMICCAVHTVCYADMAIVLVGDLLDRSLTGSYPSSAVVVSERSEHAVVVFVCIYI